MFCDRFVIKKIEDAAAAATIIVRASIPCSDHIDIQKYKRMQ